MPLFESYDRRINKINEVLNSYGISSLEEAKKICDDKGVDVYKVVKDIQPIAFENAMWSYIVGGAIAIKLGQPVCGGLPRCQRRVVVNEPGQRVLHPPEGGRHLHQLPQLNRPAEKPGRGNDEREHHCRLPEPSGEPGNPFLCLDQRRRIGHHLGQTRPQAAALDGLAPIQCDRFAVLAHTQHVVPEIGFAALLRKVQPGQRLADPVCDATAHLAVHDRRRHHEARYGVRFACELEAERP